jgi:hypothetical protein
MVTKEVVKTSDKDEPIPVAIHMCMEAMLGIFLYIYPNLKLAKCHVFLTVACVFSSRKLEKRAEQVLAGIEGDVGDWVGGAGGRDGPNNVFTYE